jgi:hypothetical protein
MSASLEGGRKLEAEVLGLYRSMDSGEKFIQQYQSTPTATERPAVTSRFPRYLFDALQAKCFPRGKRTKAEAADPAFVADIEQCVAAAHEKERLSQFAKFCGKGCDRRRILSIINARRMELLPAKTRPRKTPPQRPR